MAIEDLQTKADLERFVKQRLGLPVNLQAQLAGGFLKLLTQADRKVAFGTDNLTFTASATSAAKTVTHGLGATPVLVLAMANASAANAAVLASSSVGATTFDITGHAFSALTFAGNYPFYWLAIA